MPKDQLAERIAAPLIVAQLAKFLRELVVEAVAGSENVGSQPEDWQLKTLNSDLFDLEQTLDFDGSAVMSLCTQPEGGRGQPADRAAELVSCS